MLTKLIFVFYLCTGTISHQADVDGRDTYTIRQADGTCIEHAYKGEVLEWIETGSFHYNEDLED